FDLARIEPALLRIRLPTDGQVRALQPARSIPLQAGDVGCPKRRNAGKGLIGAGVLAVSVVSGPLQVKVAGDVILEGTLEAEQPGLTLAHIEDLESRLGVGLRGGEGKDVVLDVVGERPDLRPQRRGLDPEWQVGVEGVLVVEMR